MHTHQGTRTLMHPQTSIHAHMLKHPPVCAQVGIRRQA